MAYKTQTPWSSMVQSLLLHLDFYRAATCAVEFTLLTGTKATVIACYLPQPMEEHARVYRTISRLLTSLSHHILVLGGDFQGGWMGASHKDSYITSLPALTCSGPESRVRGTREV